MYWLWCYTCKIIHLQSSFGTTCSCTPDENNTTADASSTIGEADPWPV